MAEIEKHAKESVLKFLVGNKCDLIEKRVVSNEEGQYLANIYGIPFIETSAKETVNVNELFTITMRSYVDRLKKGNTGTEKRNTIVLDVNNTDSKKECCLSK
jgi:Ras-related protein Rab-8A